MVNFVIKGEAQQSGARTKKSKGKLKHFWLIMWLCLGVIGNEKVTAQIIPDQSLGNENSTVNSLDNNNDVINGGAIRGNNLFHSFREFNVSEGRGAFFANPDSIGNILTRVTGNNISNILGTLGVLGNANLFLINPNGIHFGANANLSLQGSFLATTADSILFENGFNFSASNPTAPPLLTVNIPIGLQFRPNSGEISNAGNLVVPSDFSLKAHNLYFPSGSLQAGGNLVLEAQNQVVIRDNLTQPFIAVSGGDLLIRGGQGIDLNILSHPDSGIFSGGNLILTSPSPVIGDAHYWSRGSFLIEQTDGSLGDLFSLYDPVIRSWGDVSFNNYIGASLHIIAGGSVNIPGTILITSPEIGTVGNDFIAENVTLSNGTIVPVNGSIQPTLDIRAGVEPTMVGIPNLTGVSLPNDLFLNISETPIGSIPLPETPNLSPKPTSADINLGIVVIKSLIPESPIPDGLVLLTNQYHPNPSLSGGNIKVGIISVANQIEPDEIPKNIEDNLGNLELSDLELLSGSGGSIFIDSRNNISVTNQDLQYSRQLLEFGQFSQFELLDVDRGAIIASASPGKPDAITLIAEKDISLENSFMISLNEEKADGGNINITAQSLILLSNFSQIITFTSYRNTRKGGDININTDDLVKLNDKTSILAITFGPGQGGNINIKTKNFLIQDDSIDAEEGGGEDTGITSATLISEKGEFENSTGKGGNITLDVDDSVIITASDSKPFRLSFEFDIIEELLLTRVGITTSTEAKGKAGNLVINTKKLILQNGAGIVSAAREEATGNAGEITINAKEIELQGKAGVVSGTLNSGNGNDLNINAFKITLSDGAVFSADTIEAPDTVDLSGNAGNININADKLSLLNGSRIGSATAGTGSGGTITINANVIELVGRSFDNEVASGIFSDSFIGSTGNSGNVNITANQLNLTQGAEIKASTAGIGDAGNIFLTSENLTIDNGSQITAATVSGEGGNITLNVPNFLNLRNNALISAEASGSGNGGNIALTTDFFISKDSNIIANAFEGRGGNINITALGVFLNDSSITASSQLGIDGVVQINTLELDPSRALIEFESEVKDPNSVAQNVCSQQNAENEFVITGKGGLPNNPNVFQNVDDSEVGFNQPAQNQSTSNPVSEVNAKSSTIGERKIIPAQGVVLGDDGLMDLVAYNPNTTVPVRPSNNYSGCTKN